MGSKDDGTQLRIPPPFGGFFDRHGWGGYLPSLKALRLLIRADAAARRPLLDKRMMMVDITTILKGDGSFKLAKRIIVDGTRVLKQLYTVMNA